LIESGKKGGGGLNMMLTASGRFHSYFVHAVTQLLNNDFKKYTPIPHRRPKYVGPENILTPLTEDFFSLKLPSLRKFQFWFILVFKN